MKFETLWNNYPTISSSIFEDDASCLKDGEREFENQCAIRMGVSLEKSGIIFFKDYYGPSQQGDHIDLWNGSRLTSRVSWFEFAIRGGAHYKAATIWFWEV